MGIEKETAIHMVFGVVERVGRGEHWLGVIKERWKCNTCALVNMVTPPARREMQCFDMEMEYQTQYADCR